MTTFVSVIMTLDICGETSQPELPNEGDPGHHAQFPFAGPLLQLAAELPRVIEIDGTPDKSSVYKAAASAVRLAGWPSWHIDAESNEVQMRSIWNWVTLSWDEVAANVVVHAWPLVHDGLAAYFVSGELKTHGGLPAKARMCPVLMLQYEV